MDNFSLKSFSFDYKNIIVDEIALNGLEGIGFDFLWKMVEKRISAPIANKIKNRFWNFIVNCDAITIYKIPTPLPRIEVLNRFDIIDNETGYIIDPPDYLDGPYEYCPIENEYGSCSNYKTRKLIPKSELAHLGYADVEEKYGDSLVMVASLEERWKSLASHAPISLLAYMTPVQYCILELVGKSRENGQTSLGKTNLTKVFKESKFLFYNRIFLGSVDLLTVIKLPLIHNKRLSKALLLRLKRFHKPSTMALPKTGRIHDIVEYLLKQPNYTARLDEMYGKGILNFIHVKRLKKSDKRFVFDQKVENSQEKETKGKVAARKTITLSALSDEESDESEEEAHENPVENQYKVKIPLMRQAFECFLRAGLKGLSQCELGRVLNVEFYTSRMICRIFKKKNLVRVFLEDKGKQRTKRYVSVTATAEMDVKFEEEKKKFLAYSNEIKNCKETEDNKTEADEVPAKKIKLEEGAETSSQNLIDYKNYTKQVVEVNLIDGLGKKEDLSPLFGTSNKSPTLRQLKFVNGIFKVLNEKKMVSGYNTLSSMVAKEINEPPMDTKRLKLVLQKLLNDKKLKMYKMLRPGRKDVHEILICAASVKPTDPALRNKYKELSTRAINNSKFLLPKVRAGGEVNLAQYSYPKYMKLRKIHEFIMKFVYFEKPENRDSDLPEGFSSLVQLIPEFTVEFSLGNLSSSAISAIPTKKISDEMLKIKLREAPQDISNAFILSSSLQFSIRTGIRILAMFGLLQLIKESAPTYDENIVLSYVFYVNRHAKILNTMGVWPRQDVNEESIQKSYYFATFDDVEKFWNDVCEISTKTKIDLPSRRLKKIVSPVRCMNEVLSCDNGQRFGDGLGPCGFDSMFFLDMARFWSTFYFKQKKPSSHISQKKLTVKIKIPKKEAIKKTKIKKPVCRSKKKPVPKTKGIIKPLIKKRRTKPDTSITWTPEEDNILMYCKIAMSIMSPTTQPGSLRLKNLVAKDILTLNDPKKEATTCHKRAVTLDSNSKLMLEKDCIIAELRHRKHLIQKYEGLFKTLRLQNVGSLTKFMQNGRKPMMELVYLILRLVKSKSYKRSTPCIALDYNDFQEHYILTTNPVNTTMSYNKTPEKCDTIITTVKEVIIFTLMASYQKELLPETADKIHKILNIYTEAQLRLAVEQLRLCGAIAAKDKLFNNHLSRFNYKGTIVHTSYKIAAVYERKLVNKFNTKFLEELFNYIDDIPPTDCLKGSPGLNCLICELLACDKMELFSVSTPAVTTTSGDAIDDQFNSTELETKFTLKAGISGWRNKGNNIRLREIYKDLTLEEEKSRPQSPTHNSEIMDEKIVLHLKEQKENGSTFKSLQEYTGYDPKNLCDKLCRLESEKVIMLVGFHENIIILTEHVGPWTVEIGSKRYIPLPWLSFDEIRYDIFLKWASTVMNKIFDNPGFSMTYLAEVCEHITPRSAQEICEFLEKYKCVSLKVIQANEAGLFSDDEAVPELTEFYKYASMDSILVFPMKDALIRFSYIKKFFLDKHQSK